MGMLDALRASAARPVRRILEVLVRPDSQTGQSTELPIESRETLLSQDGSIDTLRVRHAQFWDCGHPADQPLGGQCLECRSVSCVACHGQCFQCGRPLCLSCSQMENAPCGEEARWCVHCYRPEFRRRRWRRLASVVVGPFVEHGEARDSR